ncbi:MSHA biogenesis protein MshP [uncultured Vibrio sp.]|uniref:MSHA biogenesis protein MshP n=1 Tax=uncultured Vibrio sp. TaxID=114054 RepID=UPI002AA6F79F|nr:MSHA biogenesis protein MshP [uncultured Vibrio sp.]
MFHKRKPSGNVLIVVLFVIIIMGYLAASLMKVTWSNQSGLTREFLGTKAWFFAQSANEWALTRMYPLEGREYFTRDKQWLCDKRVNGKVPIIEAPEGCEMQAMKCKFIGEFNAGQSDAVSLFRVQATAVCGSGLSQVQRQQEVWVKE